MRRMISALTVLAACSAPPAPGWRDATQPVASAALFEPTRFTGEWHVVARYPRAADRDCTGEVMDYDGASMRWRCLAPGGAVMREWQGPAYPQTLPGRLTTDLGSFGLEDFWILWVDFDYRTAVIGTPSGAAGYVLNRDPDIPGDRMTAAREMLDFNGYDPAALVMLR